MNTLTLKLRRFTDRIRKTNLVTRRAAIFVLAAVFASLAPAVALAQGEFTQAKELPGTATDAENKTSNLFGAVRGFAGWLLLVALVIAGLMAAAGNYKIAWAVAIAAVIVYGGIWVLALVRTSVS